MAKLKKSLNLPILLLYGLGTILGAGIYVLTGEVVADAGVAAPFAFLIAAVVAAPTAYSYARLSARYPLSAGEAVYVEAAFNRFWLTMLMGLLVITIGIISAATIARGFVGYVSVLVNLPDLLIITLLVVTLTALAVKGVLESAATAAMIALVEIAGLIVIIAGGLMQTEYQNIPLNPFTGIDAVPLAGLFAGAFLAFYAFIGFEDIVNMAEETKNPERVMPAAILGSLILASLLYFAVVFVAVITVPVEVLGKSSAPMVLVVESHGLISPTFIALISILAVVNGALVQIIMASRVTYGISRMHPSLAPLARVSERTHTPIIATLVIGSIVLVLALTLDVRRLATLTSIVTLVVFTLINLALCRLQSTEDGLLRIIPWLGACLCAALAATQWV